MNFVRRSVRGLPFLFTCLAGRAVARPLGGVLGRVLARGVLRVGVWLKGSPYGHRGQDGLPAGMEVEVGRGIARSLGVAPDFVPLAASERISAVVLRHLDFACATIIVTPERLRRPALTHPDAQLYALRTLSEVPYALAVPKGELDLLRFPDTWVFLREEDATLATLHEALPGAPRPAMPRL